MSANKSYVSLHTHTTYSILDGISKRNDLIQLTKQYGMKGLAITEHGNLFNCVSFYKDCLQANVVPIIGYEAYVAPDSRFNRAYANKGQADEDAKNGDLTLYAYHLTILAKNRDGYNNLKELSTIAYKEGFYKKPRIDDEVLSVYKNGLIVLSGCLAGKVARLILAGNKKAAIDEIDRMRFIHGENFYLELMAHNMEEEAIVREVLLDVSKTHGIPTVMTGDSHFTAHGDELAHVVALNMGSNKTISSENKWTFNGEGYWYKSPEEMYKIASDNDIPEEALTNTVNICDSIQDYGFQLASRTKKFTVPLYREHSYTYTDSECDELIEYKSWQGLAERGLSHSEPHRARLQEELNIIKAKKFSSYFLIIADIVDYMRKSGIITPIGRGSSCGSLVCYSLSITGIDPVTYDIPFSRFINDGRKDLPDVDTDISQERRSEVLRYIADKYGHDRVAHIITFQSLRPKAAIDNVGRVLDVPTSIRRQATADIHDDPTSADTVIDLVNNTPSSKQLIDQIPDWLDIAAKLEGNNRNVGQHSAGIVISNEPFQSTAVPLYKVSDDGIPTTQFDMTDLAELGLLKLDMLGLKTLDVIADTLRQVKSRYGIEIDWQKIPLDDKYTYQLISSGRYVSIFQYDSAGMRNLSRQLIPENFDHLIAINCLYRPGCLKKPATGGKSILEMYLERRHNKAPIEYWHPSLEPIFKPTLGLCLLQEQIMGLAKVIAGFNDTEADEYRAAVGKKDRDKYIAAQNKLIERGVMCGHSREFMVDLADKLSGFARYGWNKGHAVAYSYISYVTAWLETHYPTEYYTSLLNSAIGDSDKLSVLISAVIQRGVKLEPPHINLSGPDFSTDGTKIYMGLSSVKMLGQKALEDIIAERSARGEFTSYIDFHKRLHKSSFVNVTVKTNLVKAKAFRFDKSHTVKFFVENCEIIQDNLKKYAGKLGTGPEIDKILNAKLKSIDAEYSQSQMLNMEKAVLNYYVTSHPVTEFSRTFALFPHVNFVTPSTLQNHYEDENVIMLGLITDKELKQAKNGKMYLQVKLADLNTSMTLRIWDPVGPKAAPYISKDQLVLLSGKTFRDSFLGGDISIKVLAVRPIKATTGLPISGIFATDEATIRVVCNIINAKCGAISEQWNKCIAVLSEIAYIQPENVDSLLKINAGYNLELKS